jgi:hypothetical protein
MMESAGSHAVILDYVSPKVISAVLPAWIYSHRVACGRRHNRHLGGHAAAGLDQGEAKGARAYLGDADWLWQHSTAQ